MRLSIIYSAFDIIQYNFIASSILTIGLAYIFSVSCIPKIITLSDRFQLLDSPNSRKSHKHPKPTFGGIGIFLGILSLLFILPTNSTLYLVLGCSFCLLIMGILDDLFNMKVLIRLILEIALSYILFYNGFKISSLYGIFGINELHPIISFLLTTVFIVGLTNAFNLLDGIDGLAGGIFCINSLTFAILFLLNQDFIFALLAFSSFGACLGFLKFNFNPAKIFMGDTGSLFLGFLMAIFFIRIFSSSQNPQFPIIFALIMLPIFDTVRIIFTRLTAKKSPFCADKNHLHHLLLEKGLNHQKASLVLYSYHLVSITLSILVIQLPLEDSLIILVILNLFFQLYVQLHKTLRTYILFIKLKQLYRQGRKQY